MAGQVQAAAAVSVPFVLAEGAKRLRTGFSRVYQRRLLNLLKRKIAGKFSSLDCPIDLAGLRQLNDFVSFDDKVTAPLHGFAGGTIITRAAVSRQFLKSI